MQWGTAMEVLMNTGKQLITFLVSREALYGIGLIRFENHSLPFVEWSIFLKIV